MKIRIARYLLTTAGRLTYDALEDPGLWDASSVHTLMHKRSGIQLWTSNDPFAFRVYNPRGSDPKVFNVLEQWVLYFKARKLRRKLMKQIEGRAYDRACYIAKLTGLEEP